MVYTPSGLPLQGITGGYGGDRRVETIVPPHVYAQDKSSTFTWSIVIESTCNGMFGVPWDGDTISPPDPNRRFTLDTADLILPNMDAWRLMWDFETLKQVGDTVPGNTPLQNLAITTANEIMNIFIKFRRGDGDEGVTTDDAVRTQKAVLAAREVTSKVFGEGWEAKGADIYNEGGMVSSGEEVARIWGIGHCHIDTAWLWPYRVTQQKVARSWSTQLDLFDRCESCCSYDYLLTTSRS